MRIDINLGSPSGVAAAGLAAFSATMAAGRILGDRMATRFGPVALVRRRPAGWLAGQASPSAC
jgi:hypothetical protein